MSVQGRRVLITGASTGIGLRTAARLAEAGARVFLTGLPPEDEVRAARAGIAGDPEAFTVMDLLDPESVVAAVDAARSTLGGIDILINNAGIATQQRVAELDPNVAEREIAVNYLGTLRVTHAVLPTMLRQGHGTILNVASTLAKVPGPTQANYSASKAAIVAFSSALRSEVEDRGIAVKVFIPGLTATTMTDALDVRTPTLLTTDEVAEHVLKALDARRAEYVTGPTYRALVVFGRLFPETARRLVKRYY